MNERYSGANPEEMGINTDDGGKKNTAKKVAKGAVAVLGAGLAMGAAMGQEQKPSENFTETPQSGHHMVMKKVAGTAQKAAGLYEQTGLPGARAFKVAQEARRDLQKKRTQQRHDQWEEAYKNSPGTWESGEEVKIDPPDEPEGEAKLTKKDLLTVAAAGAAEAYHSGAGKTVLETAEVLSSDAGKLKKIRKVIEAVGGVASEKTGSDKVSAIVEGAKAVTDKDMEGKSKKDRLVTVAKTAATVAANLSGHREIVDNVRTFHDIKRDLGDKDPGNRISVNHPKLGKIVSAAEYGGVAAASVAAPGFVERWMEKGRNGMQKFRQFRQRFTEPQNNETPQPENQQENSADESGTT